MSNGSIPFTPELVDEEEERTRILGAAKRIVEQLIQERRALLYRGYASPYLIFSDGGVVSLSHGIGEALRDVEKSLSTGSEPLGIITVPEKGGRPRVRVWRQEYGEARAELRSMAKSVYWRRFRTTKIDE